MSSLLEIKQQIQYLYKTNPHIHLDVNIARPKLNLCNVEATIKGVYPNLFMIEEISNGHLKQHSIQYSEIIMKNVIIKELNM